ncbi:MAG: peptide-methionine (R)-S-oxide reductase MsrB [Saprospiraceae bacterium]|nr:peptide-methionine (R)-S-oxide reductase MsrB [Saprospiraceae bacterium]
MKVSIAFFLFALVSCTGTSQVSKSVNLPELDSYTFDPIEKSEAEWRTELSEQEYYVLREKGTERAFTGRYWDNKSDGIYTCAGCNLPLFDSDTKFKSGTGWPSFYMPLYANTVAEESDHSHGMVRTEVLCARCGGHLGHLFPDGPAPTGLRYCINGVSLKFEEEKP